MSYTVDNTLISNREMFGQLLSKIGNAIAAPFLFLMKNSANYAALMQLNATTDAELAAKGLTRAQAVQQLFRHDG